MGVRRKSKLIKWVMTGLVVAGVAGAATYYLMQPVASAYKSVKALTGDIITFYSFSGNVLSKNRQTIVSNKTMLITQVHVNAGDLVEEGDIIFTTETGEKLAAGIGGEVVNIFVEEGTMVLSAAKLADIIDFSKLEINFRVDEYDVGVLETGNEATVKIGALNKEVKGVINSISKEGQIINGVTFFTASIDIEPLDGIRTGMSAEVKILSEKAFGVVVLPMNVIQFDERNNPFVLKSGGKKPVEKIKITTGINDGSVVEVKNGVLDGEDIFYKRSIALEDILFPEGGKNTRVYIGGQN